MKYKIKCRNKKEIVLSISVMLIVLSLGVLLGRILPDSGGFSVLSSYQRDRYNRYDVNCVVMSCECESFFEDVMGVPTDFVIGKNGDDSVRHCWLLLHLPGGDYEFESTVFEFRRSSEKYEVIGVFDELADFYAFDVGCGGD